MSESESHNDDEQREAAGDTPTVSSELERERMMTEWVAGWDWKYNIDLLADPRSVDSQRDTGALAELKRQHGLGNVLCVGIIYDPDSDAFVWNDQNEGKLGVWVKKDAESESSD